MNNPAPAASPYVRSFTAAFILFVAVAIKMVSRHTGHWSTYEPRNLFIPLLACMVTALLVGVAATRFEKLRSWFGISVVTVVGCLGVLALMLLSLQTFHGPPPVPKFKDTNEQMAYFANQVTLWVKQDRGLELDYSVDSIKTIEEELDRIAIEVNKEKPQPGTFGTALAYGAYIGEVFKRRDGGSWAADHSEAGPNSLPLTIQSNNVIFPVGWCWKRLTVGDDENVYVKAIFWSEHSITNLQSTP